jgi:hypothetical protein
MAGTPIHSTRHAASGCASLCTQVNSIARLQADGIADERP